jgi:nucleotide-binding universal stress UspA family protein
LLPSVKHIFHPTDLGTDGLPAFQHALRIAVAARASLTVLHVSPAPEALQDHLPQSRRTLAAWGMLTDEHDTAGLRALGVGVKKVVADGPDPVESCLDYLGRHPTDLIVLTTHQRGGRTVWGPRSISEPLVRNAGGQTLLLPAGCAGFVEPASGALGVRRILVALGDAESARSAARAAVAMADLVAHGDVEFHLVNVGDGGAPFPGIPDTLAGRTCVAHALSGDVVSGILSAADEADADLVVMATRGHDGFLDALLGSTTERVLRQVDRPLLFGPIG